MDEVMQHVYNLHPDKGLPTTPIPQTKVKPYKQLMAKTQEALQKLGAGKLYGDR